MKLPLNIEVPEMNPPTFVESIHVSDGLNSACVLPKAAEPPPSARKKRPAYCEVTSVHATVPHIFRGSAI